MSSMHDLPISDAQVISVLCKDGNVELLLRDWQENLWSAMFECVIGLELRSPEGKDLDRLAALKDDVFLTSLESSSKEDKSVYTCFVFYAAWNEEAIMKIVATDYSAKMLNPGIKDRAS